jgi:hypothetical protein
MAQGRRIIDAVDEVVAQLRLANQIEALRLPASAFEDGDEKAAKTDASRLRVRRMNALRAEVRAGLGIEEGS